MTSRVTPAMSAPLSEARHPNLKSSGSDADVRTPFSWDLTLTGSPVGACFDCPYLPPEVMNFVIFSFLLLQIELETRFQGARSEFVPESRVFRVRAFVCEHPKNSSMDD